MRSAAITCLMVLACAPYGLASPTNLMPDFEGQTASSPDRTKGLISQLGPVMFGSCANGSLTPGGLAIFGLIDIGRPAVPLLLDALHNPDHWKRFGAAYALTKIGDSRCIEPLIELVQNDPEPSIRTNAAFFLGQLRTPLAVPALKTALKDSEEHVRETAGKSLAKISEPQPIGPLTRIVQYGLTDAKPAPVFQRQGGTVPDRAMDAWESKLTSTDEEAFHKATEAMARLGSLRAKNVLAKAAVSNPRLVLRIQAAAALADLKDERSLAPLLEGLGAAESWGEQTAIEALGRLGNRAAVPALIRSLQTSKYEQATAAEVLGILGDRRAVGPLIGALNACRGKTDPLGPAAALALARLHSSAAIPVLIDSLTSRDAGLRCSSAAALGVLRAKQAVRSLRTLADDRATQGSVFDSDDEPVCIIAAAALRRIGSR